VAFPTVAAVYDRRFFRSSSIKPAVIDRRYSGKCPFEGISLAERTSHGLTFKTNYTFGKAIE
jgi:hypothetical protein